MPSHPSLQRVLSFLRELNPLWILAPAVLILLAIATTSLRHQVDHSERLQQRLTGTALVDALKAYADASPGGAPTRPASLADLTDDNRAGTHRNWLDAVSAESLADRSTWKLMLDAQGRVQGAQLRSDDSATHRWLPAWLAGGPGKDDSSNVYAVADAGPAPEPVAASAKPAPIALPQPVLPDTPLAPLAEQALAARTPAPAKEKLLAAAPGDPRTAAAAALDPNAKPSAKASSAPSAAQPTRILAGLEARQVLRLSGGDGSDAPVLTPRKTLPPAVPVPPGGRTAAVGAVAAGSSGSTGSPAAATPGASATSRPVASPPRDSSGTRQMANAGVASAPRQPSAQGIVKHIAPTATAPGGSPVKPDTSAPPLPGPPVMPAPIAAAKPIVSAKLPAPVRATPPAPAKPVVPARAAPPAKAAPDDSASAAASAAASTPGVPTPPATLPAAAPPAEVRMDTVIYEDSASSSAAASGDSPKTDCRALAGDSIECDTFEDTDPALYQRCYQSLSERINACIAGEPIPSLVTR